MLSYYSDKNLDIFELKKCTNTPHSRKKHFHKEISIALINKGSTNVKFEHKNYKFTEKDFLVIPSYMPHECVPENKNNWDFLMLYINHDWITKNFDINIRKNELLFYKPNSNEYKEIKEFFSNLESNRNSILKKLYLMILIEKYVIKKMPLYNKVTLNHLEKNKIKLLKDYIKTNFDRKITLEELSNISGMSKYHLIRSFKETYEISPINYQKNLRLNFAKEKLKRNVDITEIALELGYYDQSHFTNDFKRFSGTSPNHYKKSSE